MVTTEGQDPEELCQLCKEPFKIHDSMGYHHPFTGPGKDAGAALNPPKKKTQEQPRSTMIITPAPDLVLRGLLRRLGIITAEQLEAVERELTAGTIGIFPPDETTSFFSEPPANT